MRLRLINGHTVGILLDMKSVTEWAPENKKLIMDVAEVCPCRLGHC